MRTTDIVKKCWIWEVDSDRCEDTALWFIGQSVTSRNDNNNCSKTVDFRFCPIRFTEQGTNRPLALERRLRHRNPSPLVAARWASADPRRRIGLNTLSRLSSASSRNKRTHINKFACESFTYINFRIWINGLAIVQLKSENNFAPHTRAA